MTQHDGVVWIVEVNRPKSILVATDPENSGVKVQGANAGGGTSAGQVHPLHGLCVDVGDVQSLLGGNIDGIVLTQHEHLGAALGKRGVRMSRVRDQLCDAAEHRVHDVD